MSVVIPIYQAEHQLPSVIADLVPLTGHSVTPDGVRSGSPRCCSSTTAARTTPPACCASWRPSTPFVRPIWLSRNFGQHAATLAGMASSGGDWIVTMDEDGQHDPAYIGAMLDAALTEQASVVYAKPTNPAPHGALRNAASRGAKRLVNVLSGGADASVFHSYRLILGEIGRSVAAYAGAGVYLDVALGWVAGSVTTAPVELREEGEGRRRATRTRTLLSHFWRMVLTGGTRGLRLVSVLGRLRRCSAWCSPRSSSTASSCTRRREGWTSVMVVMLLSTGAILFSLGVIAEYVGVSVNMAMGKPLYLITQDPADGPLGRRRPAEPGRDPRVAWVVGSGGLLGSAVVRRLPRWAARSGRRWCPGATTTASVEALLATAVSLPAAGWDVYWCAGAGVVGTTRGRARRGDRRPVATPVAVVARPARRPRVLPRLLGRRRVRRRPGRAVHRAHRRRCRSRPTAGPSCARRRSRPTSPPHRLGAASGGSRTSTARARTSPSPRA